MTQTVQFFGRYLGADETHAGIICRVASVLALPPNRQSGAGGDVQKSIPPTAIILRDVEMESMALLQNGKWTHVHWSNVLGDPGHDLRIWRIFIEGENVRVLV